MFIHAHTHTDRKLHRQMHVFTHAYTFTHTLRIYIYISHFLFHWNQAEKPYQSLLFIKVPKVVSGQGHKMHMQLLC